MGTLTSESFIVQTGSQSKAVTTANTVSAKGESMQQPERVKISQCKLAIRHCLHSEDIANIKVAKHTLCYITVVDWIR